MGIIFDRIFFLCSYSFIATGTSLWKGFTGHHVVNYGFRSTTTINIIFDIFSSLGVLSFAFAGHSVALEIQATIPSTHTKPSKIPMTKGVTVAYLIVALCYFPVAISGYWAFGNEVEDDVLLSLEHPKWLISAANFMVFIHVIGSYQVNLFKDKRSYELSNIKYIVFLSYFYLISSSFSICPRNRRGDGTLAMRPYPVLSTRNVTKGVALCMLLI